MDKMNGTYHSIDESAGTEYQGHFPKDLPMRPGPKPVSPWKQRLRGILTFSPSSYSIFHTPDGAARIRHITMIVILALRGGMSGLSILSAVIKGSIAGIIIYSLLAVLSLWFTATCLAIIGDVEGDTRVWRFIVKRWHLDAFLGFLVVIHTGLIVAFFFGLSGWGLELTSIAMWLAILGVAWSVGWQPELPKYQRTWAT